MKAVAVLRGKSSSVHLRDIPGPKTADRPRPHVCPVPQGLKHLGVLSEPASVCAKAIEQAFLAQTRLQVWNPKRAFVLGAGQIGLLATMMLRLRGLDVFTLATRPAPNLKADIAEAYGA